MRKNIYLPINLKLKDLLKAKPPSFKYHIDCFKYILDTIIQRGIKYNASKQGYFVELNAVLLQRRIHNYKSYLSYLLDNQVIETDNQYIKGEKSRSYRLHQNFLRSGYVSDVIRKTSLIKKSRERKQIEKRLEGYEYLTKWFNSRLKVDLEGAKARLIRLMKKEALEEVDNVRERYHLRMLSVEQINNSDFYITIDNTANRVHTNLTNLKSELRNYLTYDGKQLCSIDIKNSQPFICTILFSPDFYKKSKGFTLYNISPKVFHQIFPQLPTISSLLPTLSPLMLVNTPESQSGKDFQLFSKLVDKGNLYKYFSQKFHEQHNVLYRVDVPEEKDMLKDVLFRTLYSDNRFFGAPEALPKRFFQSLFPSVYALFAAIKKKGANTLPIILQLIESEMVVRRSALAFSKMYPNIPIYTIHDSLVTLTSHKQAAYDLLKSEFEQVFGLIPSLRVEVWQP